MLSMHHVQTIFFACFELCNPYFLLQLLLDFEVVDLVEKLIRDDGALLFLE